MPRRRQDSPGSKQNRSRQPSVRALHKNEPDGSKVARALVDLALAQAEADAQAATQGQDQSSELAAGTEVPHGSS
jgi:hypothetical protein